MTPSLPVPAHHPDIVGCVVRCAAEGVPIAAIARAMRLSYDKVLHYVQRAKQLGALTEIPKPDWPAHQALRERAPTTAATGNKSIPVAHKSPKSGPLVSSSKSSLLPHEDVEFLCRHVFRLTNLEAGFLVVLLRCLFAEKEKLHAVIESQRATRPLRPLQQEVTDPKMVDVMICKLRKKMGTVDLLFVIRTSWGKGYFLDPSVKDAIYRMLDNGVAGSPAGEPPADPVPRAQGDRHDRRAHTHSNAP